MASHVLDFVAHLGDADRPRLGARFRAWRQRRRERARIARELYGYTDRELFDLGIGRADIPAILDGTYKRY